MGNEPNKRDGVVCDFPETKEDGAVATAGDNPALDHPINPASIKAGKNSGYKGPGDTTLTIDDPRMS
jgi:hypothetical protein